MSTGAIPLAADNGLSTIGSFFAAHAHLLVSEGITQVEISALAVAIAVAIGLPIGATVGHFHRFSVIAINGGNVLRALPTLSIIVIGISIYGFGLTNITVALVILALPLVLTNAYVAVDGVDPNTVRAARGMGMTGWQILVRVELPSCVPLLMAGARTSWVYVVATAYLAAFAGYAGTLGDVIAGEASYGLGGVMAAACVAIVIALLGEVILASAERALVPKGLRLVRSDAPGRPGASTRVGIGREERRGHGKGVVAELQRNTER